MFLSDFRWMAVDAPHAVVRDRSGRRRKTDARGAPRAPTSRRRAGGSGIARAQLSRRPRPSAPAPATGRQDQRSGGERQPVHLIWPRRKYAAHHAVSRSAPMVGSARQSMSLRSRTNERWQLDAKEKAGILRPALRSLRLRAVGGPAAPSTRAREAPPEAPLRPVVDRVSPWSAGPPGCVSLQRYRSSDIDSLRLLCLGC